MGLQKAQTSVSVVVSLDFSESDTSEHVLACSRSTDRIIFWATKSGGTAAIADQKQIGLAHLAAS